jgi:hypothetical protein
LLSTSHQREKKKQKLVQNNRELTSEKLQKCRRRQDWKQTRANS